MHEKKIKGRKKKNSTDIGPFISFLYIFLLLKRKCAVVEEVEVSVSDLQPQKYIGQKIYTSPSFIYFLFVESMNDIFFPYAFFLFFFFHHLFSYINIYIFFYTDFHL